jgi:glyoxylase-like metal-dependent hydrolase (beta-lactamase superfamily II)
VYLPNDGVVVTGDMVVHPVPYGYSAEPLQWIDTLRNLAKLEFDTLIPATAIRRRGRRISAR